jgi:glucosamine-6-phosphate deaminase
LNIFIQKHELQAQKAAFDVEKRISEAIDTKGMAHIILATGNSQLKFLEALRKRPIVWEKVIIFHLDEYIGLDENHPASFIRYLRENIIKHINPFRFYPLEGNTSNLFAVLKNYTYLLEKHPIDLACIGIGENGHLAFNDPGVAKCKDPHLIKEVELDHDCRMQQYNEGWFDRLDAVPKKAITLTLPAIMKAKHISCFVPDERKAQAVKKALEGAIIERCPASILREHPSVNLYLDPPSAQLLSDPFDP